MVERGQVYRCSVCGNIVEVLYAGGGTLYCCGKPMVLLEAKVEEKGAEKHRPVIEEVEEGVLVKVGEVEHPMSETHLIQWIELTADNEVYRKFLKPGDKPEALFKVKAKEYVARAYCNLHGLWSSR